METILVNCGGRSKLKQIYYDVFFKRKYSSFRIASRADITVVDTLQYNKYSAITSIVQEKSQE